MKSAYELAMERLGGTRKLSAEQKARLAEVDNLYDARAAEARIRGQDEIRDAAADPAKADAARERLASDLARIERKREEEKNRIRKG